MPAASSFSRADDNAALAASPATSQPAVSSTATRPGRLAAGRTMGPETPGYPGSPPQRADISRATAQVSSMVAAMVPVQLWLNTS